MYTFICVKQQCQNRLFDIKAFDKIKLILQCIRFIISDLILGYFVEHVNVYFSVYIYFLWNISNIESQH